jgi:hypothetical protein
MITPTAIFQCNRTRIPVRTLRTIIEQRAIGVYDVSQCQTLAPEPDPNARQSGQLRGSGRRLDPISHSGSVAAWGVRRRRRPDGPRRVGTECQYVVAHGGARAERPVSGSDPFAPARSRDRSPAPTLRRRERVDAADGASHIMKQPTLPDGSGSGAPTTASTRRRAWWSRGGSTAVRPACLPVVCRFSWRRRASARAQGRRRREFRITQKKEAFRSVSYTDDSADRRPGRHDRRSDVGGVIRSRSSISY